MTYEGEDVLPTQRKVPHYRGDKVRFLFVAAAVIIIVGESVGVDLPLSTLGAVAAATALAVAAGITNPTQASIHWVNALFAFVGSVLFSTAAIENFHQGGDIFSPAFLIVEALAILFLVGLYHATATIRGIKLRFRDV